MKNKKGSTFEGWTEAIIFSGLFMFLLASVILGMNALYSQSHGSTFGLDGEEIIGSFRELEGTVESGVEEGEADFEGASGLQLTTMWVIVKATWRTIGTVITGGWIESAANLAQLPIIVGVTLRLLFLISIAFILIKLLFRIKA